MRTGKRKDRYDEANSKVKRVKLSRYRPGHALQDIEGPEFLDNRQMKVVRLSALLTGRLYLQEGFLVLISVRG
jgi:hypothetical protein